MILHTKDSPIEHPLNPSHSITSRPSTSFLHFISEFDSFFFKLWRLLKTSKFYPENVSFNVEMLKFLPTSFMFDIKSLTKLIFIKSWRYMS